MKKLLSVITIMITALVLLVGCTTNAEVSEKIKIGIIQPVEHPSLNQIR